MELKTKMVLTAAILPAISFSQYPSQRLNPAQAQRMSPTVHRLSMQNNGNRIQVRKGDIIAVDLGSPRGGDEWRLLRSSANLRPTRETSLPNNRDYYRGRDNRNIYYFEATGNGTGFLDFGCYHGRSSREFDRWHTDIVIDIGYDRYGNGYGNGYGYGDRYCAPDQIGVYRETHYARRRESYEVVISLQSRNGASIVIKDELALRRHEYDGYWYSRGNQVIIELDRRGYANDRTLVFEYRNGNLYATRGTSDFLGDGINCLHRIK